MKAAKFYGVRDIRVEEVNEPQIKNRSDIKIRVKVAGICGSDISKYGKTGPHFEGEIIGHEFSGEVVEVGDDVQNFKKGDSVGICPAIPCFECYYCKKGEYTKCVDLQVMGSRQYQGCFAEYIVVDQKFLLKIPEGVDYETAAGIEPSCIAAHGIHHANVEPGDTVLVLGAGPIGLFSIQWAKVFGATTVIAVDIFDDKLRIAKDVGADFCINSKYQDPHKIIQDLTYGLGVDIAVESAGTPLTCAQVLNYPKKGGVVIYAGVPYGDVLMPRKEFEKILRNELNVKGTWFGNSYPFPGKEWENTLYFMQKKQIQVKPFITHRITMDEVPEMFEKIYKRDVFFSKIMVEIDSEMR
jgi:L-iditol 2-dehydrogenase